MVLWLAVSFALEPTMDVDPSKLVFIDQEIPGYPKELKGSGVSASCLVTLVFDQDGFVADLASEGCGEPFRRMTEEILLRWRIEPYAPYDVVEIPRFRVSSEFIDPKKHRGIPQGTLVDVPIEAMQWTSRPKVFSKAVTTEASCTTDVVLDPKGKPVLVVAYDCVPDAIPAVEKGVASWRARTRKRNGEAVYYRTQLTVPVGPK